MATARKRPVVRGKGEIRKEMRANVIPNIRVLTTIFKQYASPKTQRNLGDGVQNEVMDALNDLDLARAQFQEQIVKALKRSLQQDTAVGGSPTRRRHADGSITP